MKKTIKYCLMFSIISMCIVFSKNVLSDEPVMPLIDAKASLLMEPHTGKILYESNADERLAPASVTKVMTMLLIYEAVDQGKIQWTDEVTVSEHAAKMGGSQIFLEPFEKQTVRDLTKSIIIASANDAAVAMAEHIAGNEEAFVVLMNKKAIALGAKNTNFMNACGLDAEGHFTSARDLALFAREIVTKYPDVFNYSTVWQDTITHRTKRGDSEFGLTNTNKLIKWYNGATGLKTGSTGKALYCLVGTANKGGLDLISVVLGSPTPNIRFQEVMKMLDFGYANYKTAQGQEAGAEVGTVKVGKGHVDSASAVVAKKVSAVVPKGLSGELTADVKVEDFIDAPAKAGDKVGVIEYSFGGEVIGASDVVLTEDIEKASFADMSRRLRSLWFR